MNTLLSCLRRGVTSIAGISLAVVMVSDASAAPVPGRADIVGRVAATTIQVGVSTGFTFAPGAWWDTATDPGAEIKFADVNGDGRADLVARNPSIGDVRVSLSTGTGFAASVSFDGWGNGTQPWYLADVNADGLADIIGRVPSTGDMQVGLSTGTRFAPSVSWNGWGDAAADIKLADVNGDGRADLIGRNGTSGDMQVGLSTGTSFAPSVSFDGWGNGTQTWYLADVNADGFADIIGRVAATGDMQVGLSTGTKFAPSVSWKVWSDAVADIKFADVNGDGRADLIGRNANTGDVQVGLSTGTRFASPTSFGTWGSGTQPWYLADVTPDLPLVDVTSPRVGDDPHPLPVTASANGTGGDPASARLGLPHEARTQKLKYGAERAIMGKLIDGAGTAIQAASIDVYEQVAIPGAPWTKIDTVVTNATGAYEFRPHATASRRVRFAYAPQKGSTGYTASRIVQVVVTAHISIRATPDVVKRHGLVRLAGTVRIDALPTTGAWVEVQFRQRYGWQTVGTQRLSAAGRWTYKHRLTTAANTVLTFRARLRPANDVASAQANSTAVRVRVR